MSAMVDIAPYVALLKPAKLFRLLGAVTLALAVTMPLSRLEVTMLALAVFAGCVVAAGANALNMFIDRDVDAGDPATARRPIPAGEMRPGAALALALALILVGVGALWVEAGARPAAFVIAAVTLYATVYEWLKRRTPYYTLIGGAIWAAPIPVMWLSLGRPLDTAPIGAFAVAALWTTFHVWSAALDPGWSSGTVAPCFLPSLKRPQVTRLYRFTLTCALALITIALGTWQMLPFDGILIAASVPELRIRSSRSDRWVSVAAIVFIAAFVIVTATSKIA